MTANDKINAIMQKYSLPQQAKHDLIDLHFDGVKEGQELQKTINKINKL